MKKRSLKWLGIIAALLVLLLLASLTYHSICLQKEQSLRTPLGELVEVDGHNMSVYVEGDGEHTLVFLSGGGTCSPILDFRSLYTLLSDDCRIVVVEKFGYGFSDVVDGSRDIETILRQTRTALDKLGIAGPYILCPHFMSGIEALYWAQKYPEEVEAIVGLDMAVPEYYETMKISMPVLKLGQLGAALGVTRWLPGIAESDAIRYGTLSEAEKEIYRAVFYSRTATVTMINETGVIKANAEAVAANGVPQVPMLLFISNGSGGTGFDEMTWRSIPKEYVADSALARCVELDCPHYVHDHMPEEIADEMERFIHGL